jgi:class 3 adenylate cyclase/tetratricopeptide (TPR) repeat protein
MRAREGLHTPLMQGLVMIAGAHRSDQVTSHAPGLIAGGCKIHIPLGEIKFLNFARRGNVYLGLALHGAGRPWSFVSMQCGRCSATNPSGSRFCDACGAPLPLVCAACNHTNRPGARFCAGCGRELTLSAADAGGGPTAGPVATVPLLPPQLAARILSSRFAREGERKQVTVLFADIRGSTELIQELDPEQALHRLEPVLTAMADAVHRFGGTVNRMQGDGIMALFGAPLAHEDHAVRACFAARAMIESVAQLGEDRVEIRVGLNSGEVVVRSIGNDLSMEYDAVGSTAHLAHRMEQVAAPGTACLTAKTAQLAGGFVEVRLQGSFDIKGISRPVEVFELIGAAGRSRWEVRAAAHTLTRFVGRSMEISILTDALRRAASGRGQVVAVAGEAGMGKSRLAHEFLHGPVTEGWAWLTAAAMPHDRNTPYLLIAELLRSWLGVTDADSKAEIDAKLVEAAAAVDERRVTDLAPLRSLLDLPAQDPVWEGLDPLQRRTRTHDAVRSVVLKIGSATPASRLHEEDGAHSVVLKIASATPLILLVEDLHWADAESEAVLDAIVDGAGSARLLVIATYRPEYQNDWARHSYYSLVRLGPLELGAADTLLRGLLGDDADLGSLRRRIIDQTDGTPLFLEEMARTLVETGVVVSEPTRFRLTRSVDEVEIPDSVQAVIASRIDRLPVEHRTLLQIASVIGKDVPTALLRVVADVPEERLYRQVADLESLEFLYEVSDSSSGSEYSFKHGLTHAVTYDGMLLRHRKDLHARVMSAIEENYSDRIDEFTERLAEHALRGELWEKAAEYCYKAGQRANSRSGYREAIGFFDRALEAVGRLPRDRRTVDQAIEIRLGLRVALAATADLVRIHRHLEEAEALARSIDDRRRLAPILVSKSIILSNLGALEEAIEAGRLGHALAEELDDPACLVNAGFALGQAYWNRGDFAAAVEALSRTLSLVTGDARRRYAGTTGTASVLCLVSLSHSYCFTGLLVEAVARAREALEIAEETGRPYDLSYAHAALGLAQLTAGDLANAVQHLEEALHLCRTGDIRLLFPHAARYLGRAYALVGRHEEARLLLEEAIEQTKAQSLVPLHAWCAAALGLTQLLSGAIEEAEESARTAHGLASRHGYRPLQAHAARLLGEIAAERGDEAALLRAETALGESVILARELGMQPELAHCQRDLAGVFARTARQAEAQAALAMAGELYCGSGMKPYAAEVEAALAAFDSSGARPAA